MKLYVLILLMEIGSVLTYAQEAPVIFSSFDQLEKEHFNSENGKIKVINFWATWCKPCVEELPYFIELAEYNNIELLFVSLDFPRHIENKLTPFLAENKLPGMVVVLDDGNANKWINQVDPSWSGAIPATLILNSTKRAFYEQEFHSTEEILGKIEFLLVD